MRSGDVRLAVSCAFEAGRTSSHALTTALQAGAAWWRG